MFCSFTCWNTIVFAKSVFQVFHCFSKTVIYMVLDSVCGGIMEVALALVPPRLFAFELSGVDTVVLMPTYTAMGFERQPRKLEAV